VYINDVKMVSMMFERRLNGVCGFHYPECTPLVPNVHVKQSELQFDRTIIQVRRIGKHYYQMDLIIYKIKYNILICE
jgi:hypothetical protein